MKNFIMNIKLFCKYCLNHILVMTIGVLLTGIVLECLLNCMGLTFRNNVFVIYEVVIIFGSIIGIFQTLCKFKNKIVKSISLVLAVIMTLISAPYILLFYAFSINEEEVVYVDGQKMVESVFTFPDPYYKYYKYVNGFIMEDECIVTGEIRADIDE